MPRAGEYQGHHCWNCWNVALWIANDEPLYRLALDCKRNRTKQGLGAARLFQELVGDTHTPDGARYTHKAVEAALVGLE